MTFKWLIRVQLPKKVLSEKKEFQNLYIKYQIGIPILLV